MASIFEAITNFFQFIASYFKLITQFWSKYFGILGAILNYLGTVLSMFPWWIYFTVSILIIVCILYKVLGREGNA